MSAATDKLSQAQGRRQARVDDALDRQIEETLDHAGLSEDDVARLSESGVDLGAENVGPEARKKLKGIVNRLRTKSHKFTTCMNDLRKNHPEWSDERRKKTCSVLKQLAGGSSKKTSMSLSVDTITCVVDDDVAVLLAHVNEKALAELLAEEQNEECDAPPDVGSGGAQTPPQEAVA